MQELVVYNHIPKCAGSYVRELLQASYGDQYAEADNSSPPLEELANPGLRCLSVEFSVADWAWRRLELQNLIRRYDKVRMYALVRHPYARLVSSVRHSRRDGGLGFFPYLRYLRGPYIDQTFSSLNKSKNGNSQFESLRAGDILKVLTNSDCVDLTWCLGQSICLSMGDYGKVQRLNDSLKKRLLMTQCNIPGINDENITRYQVSKLTSMINYQCIGTVENINSFIDKLFSDGVIRKEPSELILQVNPNKNSGMEDFSDVLEVGDMISFCEKYPLDFLVWDMCFS